MTPMFKRAAAAVALAASVGLASAATVHVKLSGTQEVPAVKTSATAEAVITVLPNRSVSGTVTLHGVRATMAHIHLGAPGKNGPPIVFLKRGPHDTWRVPAGSKLTSAQYKGFLAGDLYLNVHTARHPAGELRGQIKP